MLVPPEEFLRPELRFLCEQDVPPERELRNRLANLFSRTGIVQRAYLARVEYPDSIAYNVALCVRTTDGNEDIALVNTVGVVFEPIFGEHSHLDMLFLTEGRERELKAVCRPFFLRESAAPSTP